MSIASRGCREQERVAQRTMGRWPMLVKPKLMGLPGWYTGSQPLYRLWLRWYNWTLRSRLWRERSYDRGDVVIWRGVRLICTIPHFAGSYAEHPWDPGAGWPEIVAAGLWEPVAKRDRILLAIVGDKRRRPDPDQGSEDRDA